MCLYLRWLHSEGSRERANVYSLAYSLQLPWILLTCIWHHRNHLSGTNTALNRAVSKALVQELRVSTPRMMTSWYEPVAEICVVPIGDAAQDLKFHTVVSLCPS